MVKWVRKGITNSRRLTPRCRPWKIYEIRDAQSDLWMGLGRGPSHLLENIWFFCPKITRSDVFRRSS